jgi:hypothetical protein
MHTDGHGWERNGQKPTKETKPIVEHRGAVMEISRGARERSADHPRNNGKKKIHPGGMAE